MQHRGVHRRHPLEDRHLVPPDDLQRLAGVEPGQQRQRAAADDRRVQAAGQAEDVEQRQAAHHHIAGAGRQHGSRRELGVTGQVRVRELGALGCAGGPRGIQDHRVVIIAGLIRLRGRRSEPGEQRVQVRLVDLEDLRARPGRALGCFRGCLVPDEQDVRAGIPDVVFDLAALQQRVHRHDDGPGGERTVEDDRERGHIRQHDADPVTRHNPHRRQQGRRAACGVPQLRVAQHQVVQAHSRAVAMFGRRLRKHGTQIRHHALLRAAPCQLPTRAAFPGQAVSGRSRRPARTGHSSLTAQTALPTTGGARNSAHRPPQRYDPHRSISRPVQLGRISRLR